MAKKMYVGVSGVARNVKQPYVGVNGVARKVKNGYVGVGGVARQFFSGGTPLGSLSVGTSVFMKINNVRTEFIVVQQGNPSTTYYESNCNGTWLLMKDIYNMQKLDNDAKYNATMYYELSDLKTYLNGTFYNLIEQSVRTQIKTVSLKYHYNFGTAQTGTGHKIFPLDVNEVGFDEDISTGSRYLAPARVQLSYFKNAANSKRVAKYNGTATNWWLRTRYDSNFNMTAIVDADGTLKNTYGDYECGVRPAMIFPSTTLVDDSFNIIAV